MEYDEICDLREQLREYVQYDGPNSMTEALELLCSLSEFPDYVSDELMQVIGKEIKDSLQYYMENAMIVEREETFTHNVRTVEWGGN